ncbi:hypothetical protein KZJ38_12920 [Paraburkholderia edwinii]|jgi:hypothetical protein|uniref:Transmembrane protein n=1 Tax=Paraburkholderia edwinii TaxID=2861782 RepID=A0ABX8UF65_9BURK|nr:hypothetical protein [Paraburkholderia edwinii]QYD67279.1 hypothetical protein KZJ38_12920 [Paraburkholderia edwinii]
MPLQYQVFEKIAFSLVVLSAVVCSSFIAYESSPELQNAVAVTKKLDWTANYATVCVSPMATACTEFAGD